MNESRPAVSVKRVHHVVFIAVTLIYWATLYVYVPILSPYLEARGLDYRLIGVVLGSYGFVQLLVRLTLSTASDRLRLRKPFIALGLLTGALSCLLFTLEGSWLWPLAARAVSGVSASSWVAFTVLYASYYAPNETARAMGNISLLTVIGQLIGMGLSGGLSDGWGWNAAFYTGTAIGVVGLTATWLIKEPEGGVAREPIRVSDLMEAMRTPVLLKAAFLSILAHSVLFITMFGFTPSQAMALGADKSDLTALVFAFMIPHAVSSYICGKWFAPRIGVWVTVGIGFAASAVCTAAIPFALNFAVLAATQAVNGFAQGLHTPLLLGLAIRDVEPAKRATAMGFYQAVYSIGMFGGPFLAGWLNDTAGLAGGFYFGAAVGGFALVMAVLFGRTESRRTAGSDRSRTVSHV